MSLLLPLVALMAAASAGVLVWLIASPETAVVAMIVVLGIVLVTASLGGAWRGAGVGLSVGLIVCVMALGGYHAWQLGSVFTSTSEPPEPPDPALLAQAIAKGEAVRAGGGGPFVLELTDQELTALAQEALAQRDGHPVRAVELTASEEGALDFEVWFKGGSTTASGSLEMLVQDGDVNFEVVDASYGIIPVPGMARSTLDDVAVALGSLNHHLAAEGVALEHVEILDGRVLVHGA